MSKTTVEVVTALALRFIERSETLRYRGKRRDNAALDFFCGAAVCAEESGDLGLAGHIGRVAVLLISVRGYVGVRELAAVTPDAVIVEDPTMESFPSR